MGSTICESAAPWIQVQLHPPSVEGTIGPGLLPAGTSPRSRRMGVNAATPSIGLGSEERPLVTTSQPSGAPQPLHFAEFMRLSWLQYRQGTLTISRIVSFSRTTVGGGGAGGGAAAWRAWRRMFFAPSIAAPTESAFMSLR